MCLHNIDRGLDSLDRKINDFLGADLDQYDSCDYVEKVPLKSPGDLSIIQLNVRGIGSKIGALRRLIDKSMETSVPELVLLSETWLTPFSPKQSIPGYDFVHNPRKDKKGGGVGILLSSRLHYKVIPTLHFKSIQYESIFVEVSLRNGDKIVVGSIYRPPNTDPSLFVDEYCEILQLSKKNKYKYIAIGLDHNLDLLKSHNHRHTERFIETNLDHLLIPTITRPTRITKSSATLIDNIIISQNLCGMSLSGILMDDISDHLPSYCILTGLQSTKKAKTRIKSRDMKESNITALRDELGKRNWEELLSDDDVNANMNCLNKILQEQIDRLVPYREYTVSPKRLRKEPWLSAGILNSIHHCKALYRKTLKANCKEKTILEYRNFASVLSKTKRTAKRLYYEGKCQEYRSNTKKLWQIINEVSGRTNDKTSLIDYITVDQVRMYQGPKISNHFAKYFSTVGKTFAEKIPKPTKDISHYLSCIRQNEFSLFLTPCSPSELGKLVDSLPNKTSSGYDNISNILLKKLKTELLTPLTHVFNQSLRQGIFPEAMKIAEVIPLYKGKERYIESNYRPISLLTTMSKILEKIVYNRVYNFLNQTGQIVDTQYGFREGHSCDNAVSHLVGKILKNQENKLDTVAIYLDLSKAFDTLDHEIVLEKMYQYGIRGEAYNWFKSYLKNRKLRVKCGVTSTGRLETSDTYDIDFGAPQGSCLGPLIFLIFCNDLQLHLDHMMCFQFADDTTFLYGHRNKHYMRYCIESDLENLQDWFNANKLTLNLKKTVYMLFRAKKGDDLEFELKLNGETIPRVTSTKFLGTWIDDQLSWKEHLSKLCTRLNVKLGLLYKIKNLLTTHSKKLLYYAQFHSILSYAMIVWGPMVDTYSLNKLQKLQNKAVSTLFPKLSTDICYSKSKILRVRGLIKLEEYKLGYKLCHNRLPRPLHECLLTDHCEKSTEKQHGYNTRHKSTPNLPQTKTRKYRNSLLFSTIQSYMHLPLDCKGCKTLTLFVRKCKTMLLVL